MCVVHCLRQYESATQYMHPGYARDPRLLIYIKPHKSVPSQRMDKDLLAEAGVNTNVFKAHSMQDTSTSAVMSKCVSIQDILLTPLSGGSSKGECFCSLYVIRKLVSCV